MIATSRLCAAADAAQTTRTQRRGGYGRGQSRPAARIRQRMAGTVPVAQGDSQAGDLFPCVHRPGEGFAVVLDAELFLGQPRQIRAVLPETGEEGGHSQGQGGREHSGHEEQEG